MIINNIKEFVDLYITSMKVMYDCNKYSLIRDDQNLGIYRKRKYNKRFYHPILMYRIKLQDNMIYLFKGNFILWHEFNTFEEFKKYFKDNHVDILK